MQVFEKEIGNIMWRLSEPSVVPGRILQLRITKTLGAPFMALMGASVSDEEVAPEDESIPMAGFAAALNTINPVESVELIKDLCELTINGAKQRKTNYNTDFSISTDLDMQVAVWVVESIFGNFIKELLQNNLQDQLLQILPSDEESQ